LSAHNEIDVDDNLVQEFQQKYSKLKQILNEIMKEFSAEELRSNVGSTEDYKRFSSLRKEFRSWYRTCQVTQKHILQIKHGVPFYLINAQNCSYYFVAESSDYCEKKTGIDEQDLYDTLDAHNPGIF